MEDRKIENKRKKRQKKDEYRRFNFEMVCLYLVRMNKGIVGNMQISLQEQSIRNDKKKMKDNLDYVVFFSLSF